MKILLLLILCVAPALAIPSAFEVDDAEAPPVSRPLFPELEKRLAASYTAGPDTHFAPVTPQERKRFAEAFALLLSEAVEGTPDAPTAAVRTAFDALGFRIESIGIPSAAPVWGLFESPERPRGAGVFLLRTGPDAGPWHAAALPTRGVQRVVLLAPHPRTDRGTEVLAQRLFGLSRARALIQASTSRAARAPDGTPGDTAHRSDTFFQAATEVLDARLTDQLFLQLHGFEVKLHDDLPRGTAVILSDANPEPRDDPRFLAAASMLRARHRAGSVALWGTDTKRLGGTTNAQARYINPRGRNTFMHVEMSAVTRTASLNDTAGLPPPANSWMASLMTLITGR